MRTPLGPTRHVRNIEASVFRRLPVTFPVGVAISIRHAMGRFVALATVLQSKRATFQILRINAHKVQTLKY